MSIEGGDFLVNRKEEIKKKGFRMRPSLQDTNETYSPALDFSKIKVGVKTLEDAVVSLGEFKRINPRLGDKQQVLKAINNGNKAMMIEISNFFYRTSGIYARLCRYMAYLYKYDWFITPFVKGCEGLLDPDSGLGSIETSEQDKEKKKQFQNFFKVLKFFQAFEVKRFCGEVALKVIRNGSYYGYLLPQGNKVVVQQLPVKYCRSRFKISNRPVVEFNMKYFRDAYPDETQRYRILKLFPKDFQKGYKLYIGGKLKPDFPGDESGWYVLDPKSTVKFNINEEDFPPFISVIPAIIDLDAAQQLDRKKMAQKLLKIIIQKMPLDKNGDLIFDVDEAQELHNNAVQMVSRAIGVDILTTFADVQVADMSDRGTTTTIDDLQKVQRTVYNEAGVSQLQFNSDGNIALNNSIANDEASMYNLLTQFESFLNLLLEPFNKSPKRCYYQAQFLPTTIYNYKDLAKLYKEHAQMGYTKMLPPVALGQTQSSVLANAFFENDILDLVRVFVPPLTSNVMNAEALQQRSAVNRSGENGQSGGGKESSGNKPEGAGRPEKQDNEKTEKTIMNKQSM